MSTPQTPTEADRGKAREWLKQGHTDMVESLASLLAAGRAEAEGRLAEAEGRLATAERLLRSAINRCRACLLPIVEVPEVLCEDCRAAAAFLARGGE